MSLLEAVVACAASGAEIVLWSVKRPRRLPTIEVVTARVSVVSLAIMDLSLSSTSASAPAGLATNWARQARIQVIAVTLGKNSWRSL